MKTAILLLIMSLGFMWYRGDLEKPIQEIEALINPEAAHQQAAVLPKDFFESVQREVGQAAKKNQPIEGQRDFSKVIQEESRPATVNELVVKDGKAKPLGLDVFTKEKSSFVAQTKWLESHQIDDGERGLIDKFHKLVSEGKWE